MSEQKDNMARDPARNDLLILTDLLDRQTGTATKEQAHRSGLLHRAFSVMLYRDTEDGREYLISRRADGKYHSAGLWANSCCSHPRDGETLPEAARSRVREGNQQARAVTGMQFSCDQAKAAEAVEEARRMEGVYYVRAWVNEGRLRVGDDIMKVLIGADIRPHAIQALETLVGALKNRCVTETELYDD